MAGNDVAVEDLRKVFQTFCVHGKTDKSKTNEMDGKNWSKCCKDTKVIDGKLVTSTDVDIVFSKVKAKAARVITFDQFQEALKELSKKKFKKMKTADEQAQAIYQMIVAGEGPTNQGVTKTSKTGGVDKMTDASQYTGSHKERFDASGKGKGIEGRKDLADGSGYVGNYKGSGTYDEKVGK
uniref:tubulin polymerization-promoting protein family member 2-like n=1 Tax=Styela clava TaxID=7725 RepID=UPI001939B4CA|nr:tubulin polymerization-promoting protein family member 2-like [Styela clava]